MRITTVTGRLLQPASQPKNLFKLILNVGGLERAAIGSLVYGQWNVACLTP
jgi:hypothetical protein